MTTAFAGPLVVGTQFSRFVKFESRFAPSSHLPKTMLLKRLNRSFKTRRSFGAAPSLSVFIMANANNNGGDSKDGGASTPPNASSMPPSASSKGFEAKLEYVWNLFEKAEEDKKLLYLHEYNILLERMTKAQEGSATKDQSTSGVDPQPAPKMQQLPSTVQFVENAKMSAAHTFDKVLGLITSMGNPVP